MMESSEESGKNVDSGKILTTETENHYGDALQSTKEGTPSDQTKPKSMRSRDINDTTLSDMDCIGSLEYNRLRKPDEGHTLYKDKGRGQNIEYPIKFRLYELPDQVTLAKSDPSLGENVEHTGVLCDGMLCVQKSTPIRGLRYHCAVCHNIDFCSDCLLSSSNLHDTNHAMVKCILPTTFSIVQKLDEESGKALLSRSSDPSVKLDNILHIVVARSKSAKELDDISNTTTVGKMPPLDSPINESPLAVFIIRRPERHAAKTISPKLLELYPAPEDDRFVTTYNVDQHEDVSVKYQSHDGPPNEPAEGGVIHYQDADLLLQVLTGQLQQYNYESSSRNKFFQDVQAGLVATRLIDLKPGGFDDKLECEIRAVNLAEEPVYEALSYTWKETGYERVNSKVWTKEIDQAFKKMIGLKHAIYCENSFFEINLGLRDALRRLRHPIETRTYWIDQLSINQSSHKERAYQVEHMLEIYNRAKRVILWTGDEDEDTQTAFDIVKKLASAKSVSMEAGLPLEEVLRDAELDIPPFESPAWGSLLNFFLRPVFGRVWVIQEVVVAQDITVRCGDQSIKWSDFASAASLMTSEASILRALPYDQFVLDQQSNRFQLTQVIMLKGLREDFHALRQQTMESLLFNTGIFQSTDPKDIIYAKMGIRTARDRFSTTIEHIIPNYEKRTQDVFTECTKTIIAHEKSLNICGFTRTRLNSGIVGLPSWVPDYTSGKNAVFSLSRPEPPPPYNASADSEMTALWPYEDFENLLVISSYQVEKIAMVANSLIEQNSSSLGATIAEWTFMASHCGQTYVSGEFTPDVFWRTCIADSTITSRESPAPASYHQSMLCILEMHFLPHLASFEEELELLPNLPQDSKVAESMNPVIATLVKEADSTLLARDKEAAMLANGAFIATCMNRRFFITENNYIGLGPLDTEVGDEVHILAGTKVPFIMRPIEVPSLHKNLLPRDYNFNLSSYTMIGETYVHGIMKGEALERISFEWREICIH